MSKPGSLLAIIILPLVLAAAVSAQTVEHGVEQIDRTRGPHDFMDGNADAFCSCVADS